MKLNPEMEALLDIVENGSPSEKLRAAGQLERLTRQRRLEREQAKDKEQDKVAATK